MGLVGIRRKTYTRVNLPSKKKQETFFILHRALGQVSSRISIGRHRFTNLYHTIISNVYNIKLKKKPSFGNFFRSLSAFKTYSELGCFSEILFKVWSYMKPVMAAAPHSAACSSLVLTSARITIVIGWVLENHKLAQYTRA